LWIKSNDAATIYTHIYDIGCDTSGNVTTLAKYNTSLSENLAADIENSSLEAVWMGKSGDGLTRIEFKVKLSEFNGETNFDYFVSYAAYTNAPLEYLTLFGQNITIDETNRATNFPFNNWEDIAADCFIVENELISNEEVR